MTRRSDEQKLTEAFGTWLISPGWTVQYEVDWCDIVAEQPGHRLYVEAKGRTTSPGLDIDTAYGQLLRRMPATDDHIASFALVVRDEPRSGTAALRVPARKVRVSPHRIGRLAKAIHVLQNYETTG